MIMLDRSFETIYQVAANMRERDYEEIVSMTACDSREALALYLAERHKDHGRSFVFGLDDGVPIAVLSLAEQWPGVWSMGLFATDSFQQIGLSLTKLIVRGIIPALDEEKAHRVECVSIEGYTQVHRWLEALGLDREGVLRNYGRDGQDYVIFAWRRPHGAKTVRWKDRRVVPNVHV